MGGSDGPAILNEFIKISINYSVSFEPILKAEKNVGRQIERRLF